VSTAAVGWQRRDFTVVLSPVFSEARSASVLLIIIECIECIARERYKKGRNEYDGTDARAFGKARC